MRRPVGYVVLCFFMVSADAHQLPIPVIPAAPAAVGALVHIYLLAQCSLSHRISTNARTNTVKKR